MAGTVLLSERWRAQALDVCATVEDAFADAPERIPAVRLRHGVSPAHDQADICYVFIERVRTRQEHGLRCALIPVVRFRVELLRAWPADPDLEADDDAAQALLEDAGIVWTGMVEAMQTRTPFPSAPELNARAVVVGDLTPIESNGALAGWRFPIEVDQLIGNIN